MIIAGMVQRENRWEATAFFCACGSSYSPVKQGCSSIDLRQYGNRPRFFYV